MNDEIQQKQLRFTHDYGEYNLQMKMIEDQKLQITLINTNKFDYYFITIGQTNVSYQPAFKNLIDTPSEIIQHVSNNFSSVLIGDGQIKIFFTISNKVKQIKIKLKQKIMSQSQIMELKLHQIKKTLEIELQHKLQMFQQSNYRNEQRIFHLEDRVKKGQEELVAVKKQLSEIIELISSNSNKNSTKIKQEKRYQQQQYVNKQLNVHPQCPQKQHFKTTFNKLADNLTVQRSTPNGWYNFTNIRQIKTGEVVIYRVKIKKLTKKYLGVGFGTKSAFGTVKASQPQGIFYLSNGNIYQFGGKAKPDRLSCDTDDIVETQCDLNNKTIWWWKNGMKIGDSKIPNNLAKKSFYFMIIMHFQGDSLQISEQKQNAF